LALLGLVTVAALLALALLLAQPGEAQTITVDDDGPADYDNLRDASKNASAGDTIFIYPGNYSRISPVNDSISYIGSAREEVIVQNVSTNGDQDILIKDLSVESNMLVVHSTRITFENTHFYSGIQVSRSREIFIYNSTVDGNQRHVIDIDYTVGVTLKNNSFTTEKFYEHTNYGVKIVYSSNITITENIFYGRDYGIYHRGSLPVLSSNTISHNSFENHITAIYYDAGVKAEISYNVIKNSEIGIRTSSTNDIKGNVFKNVETQIIGINDDEGMFIPAIGGFNTLLMLTNICVIHKVRRRRKQ